MTRMNLSHGSHEHVPLADNELILDTYVVVLKDKHPECHWYAAIVLYNLARGDENTVKIVNHR